MADLVVKSNKLVQALQTLTLSETRLLQLAIVDARETGQGLSAEEPLELNASRYATAFNVSPDAAYLALVEAEDSLFKRQFTITNEDGTLTKSRWIQDANYRKGEGRILVTLTRVVIEHVTKIDGFEQYFTSYHLKKTSDFKSVYAVRLYELLMQWKSVGKTPIYELNAYSYINIPPIPVRTIPVVPVSQTTGYEKNLISLKLLTSLILQILNDSCLHHVLLLPRLVFDEPLMEHVQQNDHYISSLKVALVLFHYY